MARQHNKRRTQIQDDVDSVRRALERDNLLPRYTAHFFPHANVDMFRLRFLVYSLLSRISDAISRGTVDSMAPTKKDNTQVVPYLVRRLATVLRRNYIRRLEDGEEDDDHQQLPCSPPPSLPLFEDFCTRCVIHVCEHIIVKAEALLYESTDGPECVRRVGGLARGCRDLPALEIACLSLVDWRLYADADALHAMELEAEHQHPKWRFFPAVTSGRVRALNDLFTPVQLNGFEENAASCSRYFHPS